jgi:hypothetical protein
MLYAGREATEEFEMVHPANTLEKHAKHIGASLLSLYIPSVHSLIR